MRSTALMIIVLVELGGFWQSEDICRIKGQGYGVMVKVGLLFIIIT